MRGAIPSDWLASVESAQQKKTGIAISLGIQHERMALVCQLWHDALLPNAKRSGHTNDNGYVSISLVKLKMLRYSRLSSAFAHPIEMSKNEVLQKQADLLYDYIKFHLGLYIATPSLLAILATSLGVADETTFQVGLAFMVLIYFVSGVHASIFVGTHILKDWKECEWSDDSLWIKFGKSASCRSRKFWHHYLYWIGLCIGLGSTIVSVVSK